ncbi:MAG: tetraacyldisaccharide 4'-kinase [Oceanospirillales bacterium]|nr:MAG: tetraacyldisaccharide 4'-kinase [Oceanospirillales bacterium]
MIQLIERGWYQQASWLKVLRPLSILFTRLSKRRRDKFQSSDLLYQPPVPVIVVGNISVGGTGKTPVVLALIELLRSYGYRPGVVSRGYGGKPPSYPWRVADHQSSIETGDEPLLIHTRGQVPVVIDPDRPAAVRHLLANSDCNLVISDDGLQHYALKRDIEIAVIDGVRGLGNQRCLPEGPLREPPERLSEVDFVLQNGGTEVQHPRSQIFTLASIQIMPLQGVQTYSAKDWLDGHSVKKVHAVCGIGNPERFFNTLKELGLEVIEHGFSDHHQYTKADFNGLQNYPIIMTEKDAVKCKNFDIPDSWVLQVAAMLPDTFKDSLLQRLAAIDTEGKENG